MGLAGKERKEEARPRCTTEDNETESALLTQARMPGVTTATYVY